MFVFQRRDEVFSADGFGVDPAQGIQDFNRILTNDEEVACSWLDEGMLDTMVNRLANHMARSIHGFSVGGSSTVYSHTIVSECLITFFGQYACLSLLETPSGRITTVRSNSRVCVPGSRTFSGRYRLRR